MSCHRQKLSSKTRVVLGKQQSYRAVFTWASGISYQAVYQLLWRMHKPLLFCRVDLVYLLTWQVPLCAQKWCGYKVVDHTSRLLFKSDLVLRCFCRPEITGTSRLRYLALRLKDGIDSLNNGERLKRETTEIMERWNCRFWVLEVVLVQQDKWLCVAYLEHCQSKRSRARSTKPVNQVWQVGAK